MLFASSRRIDARAALPMPACLTVTLTSLTLAALLVAAAPSPALAQEADAQAQADGVWARFKLVQPEAPWRLHLRGFIHNPPWYLPQTTIPAGGERIEPGAWSAWFDIKAWAGDGLHGRMNRSGGVAEFPNVRIEPDPAGDVETRRIVIQLATQPDPDAVVRTFDERFTQTWTSFLVSPNLARDADELETFTQMTARQLAWAREASGGKRVAPRELIFQTSFYGPNMPGAEALWLLGYNVVGGTTAEIRERFPELRQPGHTHRVHLGVAATRESVRDVMKPQAEAARGMNPGVLYNLSDEIVARPPIGDNAQALAHFHAWLDEQGFEPAYFGVEKLTDVKPIENPQALGEAQAVNPAAANRVFYHTSRFRQLAGTDRLIWNTEVFREFGPEGVGTSSLVADHPYFAGTGMGMGLRTSNAAWGGYPLALDWFDIGRRGALDVIGIEDWMGLQYMYGPNYTWEGFQLMGFQATIFRSASRGRMPIQSWITPSDETNFRLKAASSMAQGAKHIFFWTFGPTALGTENYWSDLRGAYEGSAAVARHMAGAEHIIAPGATRKTRVALLYSVSSDLWQPFHYIHMLERRGLYFSLIHDQYLVDMLTEEDLAAGRLDDYAVLYTADPNLTPEAVDAITGWVRDGGRLVATAAAGSRNHYNEPVPGLAPVLGIEPELQVTEQPGRYHIRGALNGMDYLDTVTLTDDVADAADLPGSPLTDQTRGHELGAIGVKTAFTPAGARVIGVYRDGSPAVTHHRFGQGAATYFGVCPGIAYFKEARFVPRELAEDWPADLRAVINSPIHTGASADEPPALPLVSLSHPVVEAGVYDSDAGAALVLGNFTYKPIDNLRVTLPLPAPADGVRSIEHGELSFETAPSNAARVREGFPHQVTFTVPLGLSDVVVIEFADQRP